MDWTKIGLLSLSAACYLATAYLAFYWQGKALQWQRAAQLLMSQRKRPEARTVCSPMFHVPRARARNP